MKKNLLCSKSILSCFLLFCAMVGFSQITLTATSGTATGSFTYMKGAFDAINIGIHMGRTV